MSEKDAERLQRLEAECCRCEKCGHVQAEPNWCHECRHRTTCPDWAKPLVDAYHERNELAIELDDVRAAREKAEKERDEAREALEFYADRSNYEHLDDDEVALHGCASRMEFDMGDRARAVLSRRSVPASTDTDH